MVCPLVRLRGVSTKVDVEGLRRLLRWLGRQPMGLEQMEDELVAWFCWWQARKVNRQPGMVEPPIGKHLDVAGGRGASCLSRHQSA